LFRAVKKFKDNLLKKNILTRIYECRKGRRYHFVINRRYHPVISIFLKQKLINGTLEIFNTN